MFGLASIVVIVTGGDTAHDVMRLGDFEVGIATDAGPRVVTFARVGGHNLFADLGDDGIDGAAGWYSFIGGHRLWAAPEVPELTYHPDGDPVEVDASTTTIAIRSHRGQPVAKSIEIALEADCVAVTHTVSNQTDAPLSIAPWAITQLVVGGSALLPMSDGPRDPHGLQAADAVVRWPYTPLDAPEISLCDGWIEVHASSRPQKVKIGTTNPRGWLAYRYRGETFVKWTTPPTPEDRYGDLGATAQCFRDDRFLELETLGPLTELPPGGAASHVERWTMLEGELGVSEIDRIVNPERPM